MRKSRKFARYLEQHQEPIGRLPATLQKSDSEFFRQHFVTCAIRVHFMSVYGQSDSSPMLKKQDKGGIIRSRDC